MLDDVVLWLQGLVDRLARWVRLRVPADSNGRRFLVIQIDGLSRETLQRALHSRGTPGIARLMAAGRLQWRDLSVGLPTSTPSFQAALMYGVYPDIPGFHYYDKREKADRYFPRPGVADEVEARHARGRRGIMEGGACYGCVFTGGATESLWTFARLLAPTRAGGALLRVPLSGVLLGWVVVKCLVLTVNELGRALLRLVADPLAFGRRRLRWLLIKIGLSIWTRQLFTLAASADLYRGAPAVYVNYLEYDVFAHSFGPSHPLSLRALRRTDSSIAQLARIVRRLPEYQYDLYVLSDHGQTPTRLFDRVSGGTPAQIAILDILSQSAEDGRAARPRPAPDADEDFRLRNLRGAANRGVWQRFLTYMERDFPARMRERGEHAVVDGVHVILAGPNAFVYFTDVAEPLTAEEIDRRYPGAAEALSRHLGIGFVLARSADGPVCWYRGRQVSLESDSRSGPFAQRPDREVIVTGLRQLMAMPSAGDLVLYGIGAPGGDVSFIDELGAHAGPSAAELQTFILHPPSATLPGEPLTHPIQLYPHFLGYRNGRAQ